MTRSEIPIGLVGALTALGVVSLVGLWGSRVDGVEQLGLPGADARRYLVGVGGDGKSR